MPRRNLTIPQMYERYRYHFAIFVRYMIIAAEQKRFVSYSEVSKLLGISNQDIRDFAGYLGDFCIENNLPALNALIVNTTGKPGRDWYTWAKKYTLDWDGSVSDCLKRYHLTRKSNVTFANTSRLDPLVEDFLG